jgi:hypothetical protein
MLKWRSFLAGRGRLSVTFTGEWHLQKAKSAEPGYPTTDIAFRMISESVAWRVEPRVFVFLAFDGAWLAPAWLLGDQVGGQAVSNSWPACCPGGTVAAP